MFTRAPTRLTIAKKHRDGHHGETEHQQIEHDSSLVFHIPQARARD